MHRVCIANQFAGTYRVIQEEGKDGVDADACRISSARITFPSTEHCFIDLIRRENADWRHVYAPNFRGRAANFRSLRHQLLLDCLNEELAEGNSG